MWACSSVLLLVLNPLDVHHLVALRVLLLLLCGPSALPLLPLGEGLEGRGVAESRPARYVTYFSVSLSLFQLTAPVCIAAE